MSRLVQEYFKNYTYIRFTTELDDDTYNNLLVIERCVEDCYKKGLISDFELSVIQNVCKGYTFSDLAEVINADRLRISNTFKNVCSRIAYILGEEFTDTHLEEKYYAN